MKSLLLVSILFAIVNPIYAEESYSEAVVANVRYDIPSPLCYDLPRAVPLSPFAKCYLPSLIQAGKDQYQIAPDRTYQVLVEGTEDNQRISSLWNVTEAKEERIFEKGGKPAFRTWGKLKSLEWRAHKVKEGLDFHALIVEKEVIKDGKRGSIFKLFYLGKDNSCFAPKIALSLPKKQKLADQKSGTCLDRNVANSVTTENKSTN